MQMFCEELLSWTKGSDSKRRHEKESGGPGERVSALQQIQLLIGILLMISFFLCQ